MPVSQRLAQRLKLSTRDDAASDELVDLLGQFAEPLVLSPGPEVPDGGGSYFDVDVQGPAYIAGYVAWMIVSQGALNPSAFSLGVQSGTLIQQSNNNFTPVVVFQTLADGTATIRVTDPGEDTSAFLLVEPVAIDGDGGRGGTSAGVALTFT